MKTFTIPYRENPYQYAPCEAVATLREMPIEDHPRFCKPNASLRFQNKRIRKQFRQMKDAGIETFYEPVWEITKR